MPQNEQVKVNVEAYASNEFGMTDEDLKNQKLKSLFGRLKYFLEMILPTVIKIINTIVYYTLKFIKAFVKSTFEMIKGGS